MRDLADLMNDALTERAGSLADLPTAQVGDRLHRRVRFRRARRHTLEAGGATAACAVLGATAWFGVNGFRQEPVPAVSPTVSTPAPSPSASPSQPPSPSATPVAVTDEHPGPPADLPDAGRAAGTDDAGWVLGIYRSTPADYSSDEPRFDERPERRREHRRPRFPDR